MATLWLALKVLGILVLVLVGVAAGAYWALNKIMNWSGWRE